MNADYVTIDAGTGAVHTAPGHGADDVIIIHWNITLEFLSPVDDKGHMTKEAGKYEGMFYRKSK